MGHISCRVEVYAVMMWYAVLIGAQRGEDEHDAVLVRNQQSRTTPALRQTPGSVSM